MPAGNITQTLAQTLIAARIVAGDENIPAAITSAGQIIYDAGIELIDRYAPDALSRHETFGSGALGRLFLEQRQHVGISVCLA